MIREFSAGGIVFNSENQVLLTQHSQNKHWGFPKGWLDEGETVKEAAIREVREEGGVEAKIIRELPQAVFFFQINGQKIKKTVTYFLMEYVSGDPKDHDWEMEEAGWLEKDQVLGRITYSSDKKVFQEALKYL